MISILFTLFSCFQFSVMPRPSNMRLIDFGSPNQQIWMTEKQVEDLARRPKHNFMDITDFQNFSSSNLKVSITRSFPTQPVQKALVNSLIPKLSLAMLKNYNNKLTSFFNRYYTADTGVEAANMIFGEFASLAEKNPSTSISHFKHKNFPQPSVIARIAGTGPNADEIVILGAHEDSTAGGKTRKAPGSDDDASGTMTVLEVFRVLMESGWSPSRTIEFHTYAAEEVGLLGSQDIAQAYQKQGKLVYSMMQLDMTIYPGKNGKGQIGIITDYTDPDLSQFIRILVDAYSNIDWVNSKCGYACSDHASWTKAGYAACFPFEGPFSSSSPWIHTAEDTLDKYSLEHGLEFAKIALGYIIELGSFPPADN